MILRKVYEMTCEYKQKINNTSDKEEIRLLIEECELRVLEIINNFNKNSIWNYKEFFQETNSET